MQYELDRHEDGDGEPPLADMVEKAIRILEKEENGYFLFVESKISYDHDDHYNRCSCGCSPTQTENTCSLQYYILRQQQISLTCIHVRTHKVAV